MNNNIDENNQEKRTSLANPEIIKKYIHGKELTNEITINGLGTVRTYGELNLEKMIERLLQTEYMKG
jgi:hypothetical protein